MSPEKATILHGEDADIWPVRAPRWKELVRVLGERDWRKEKMSREKIRKRKARWGKEQVKLEHVKGRDERGRTKS